MIRCERDKYYKHASKARDNPKKYMSIILDGTCTQIQRLISSDISIIEVKDYNFFFSF